MIDETGNNLGVLPTPEALKTAYERGFDLVEISPSAAPPVCKIMDYGKYKYQEHKKEQQAKHKQHFAHLKEIRLRPLTGKHDLETKLKHAREFLTRGDKVTVMMRFRGREQAHRDIGYQLMKDIIKNLEDVGVVESPLTREGPRLVMSLIPKK